MRLLIPLIFVLTSACGGAPATDPATNPDRGTATTGWEYRVDNDEMRGRKSWSATLAAENSPELGFPYQGGGQATIIFSQNADEAPFDQQPYLIISNAQFDCNSLCYFSAKFDNGEIVDLVGTEGDCGNSKCVNLNVPVDSSDTKLRFAQRMSRSKKIVLEVPLYEFGLFQYKFVTEGLVWPRKDAPTARLDKKPV